MSDLQRAIEDAIRFHELQLKSMTKDIDERQYPTAINWYKDAARYTETALEALHEKQQREEGTCPSCEVCAGGEMMYSRGDDTAELNGTTLTVRAGAYFETISEFEITNCPMCGRQLSGNTAMGGEGKS